jgi:hypothetical protein
MKSKTDTLMRELRQIDPLGSEGPGSSPAPPDDALLRRILATDPKEAGNHGFEAQARRARHGRRVLAPIALAAAALTAFVALPGGGDDQDGSLGPLPQIALAAASQAPPPAASSFYSKKRLISMDTAIAGGGAWSVYRTEVREEWRDETGSGRLRVVTAPTRFVGPNDRAAWQAAGSPSLQTTVEKTEERPIEAGTDEAQVELANLAADPDALLSELSRRADQVDNATPRQVRVLLLMAELLQDPAATPDLRAALYRAAEQIPGIQYFGETEDSLGRPGVAIGMESDYSGGLTRYELICDPETSEVLATASIGLERMDFADAEPPVTLETTLFLESRP